MTCAQKITFAEMREQGVRGVLIYCLDYRCSHSTAISGDRQPNHNKAAMQKAAKTATPPIIANVSSSSSVSSSSLDMGHLARRPPSPAQ
jgi:hypothetical protein